MDLAEHFKALEEQLLQSELRKNRDAVSALLAEDFCEFGSSGRVYDREQILAALSGEPHAEIAIVDFHAKQLSADVVLVTYQSVGDTQKALRSSLWVLRGEHWQMVFHQGTKIVSS